VNVPASLADSGQRERHFHKSKAAALKHASKLRDQLKKHGEAASTIRPSLAEAATLAESILKPWGVPLVEAARIVAAIRKREAASRSVEFATNAWMEANEGLRSRTLLSYKNTATRLKAAFPDQVMAAITAEELQAAVAPPGSAGAGVLCRLRNTAAFWRWSAKRGWCDAAVIDQVDKPKGGSDAEIVILTPDEAATLLRTAEASYPQAVPMYALALFAGIRAEELTRLDSGHVSPTGIDLDPTVTKKRRRRHITPCPTLAAWLEAYPFEPCAMWREVDCACRRLVGWKVAARLLKEPPEPTRGPWPQNALRHSHASYALADGARLEELLFEFGHSGGPQLLRQHYLGRASKSDALEFFAIGPHGTKIEKPRAGSQDKEAITKQ